MAIWSIWILEGLVTGYRAKANHSVGCHYEFGELPLAWLGLPVPR